VWGSTSQHCPVSVEELAWSVVWFNPFDRRAVGL
jgi:hypothetical protein